MGDGVALAPSASVTSSVSALAPPLSVSGFLMPLPCSVSVEPTSAKVAVAGQIGRLVLRVRTAAGDEAFGAHLLIRVGGGSGQVTILDREVTAVASYVGTAIAEVRFLCGAGQATPISIEIDVAGTETATFTINLPVKAPEIYMPAPDPWWGFGIYSALDKFNGLAATPDLFLEPPSAADPAGTKAYAGDASYVPWLAFEAADVIFSHRQLELFDLGGWLSGASLGAPPPLWMVSTLPCFDGKGGKLDRSAVVRISCPADPLGSSLRSDSKIPGFHQHVLARHPGRAIRAHLQCNLWRLYVPK